MTTPPAAAVRTDPADGAHALSVLLEEYRALKAEQIHRIGVRDNLVYAVIVAVAAVAGGTPLGGRFVPLLLPPVCLLLGWVFLSTDVMVTQIGRYLRSELTPQLTTLAGPGLLRWENGHHTGDRRRRQRKAFQLAVDLGTFCLPAVVALVVFWATAVHPHPALVLASIAEALATAALGWQIAAYAEIPRTTRTDGDPS